MFNTTFIDRLIEDGKNAEISYRNLHSLAELTINYKTKIKAPYMSLTSKYKDFLDPITLTIPEFSEQEKSKYYYRPKLLSLDLYKTTELWYTILELNGILSISEFKPKKLKVLDPKRVVDIINEILILEGRIK